MGLKCKNTGSWSPSHPCGSTSLKCCLLLLQWNTTKTRFFGSHQGASYTREPAYSMGTRVWCARWNLFVFWTVCASDVASQPVPSVVDGGRFTDADERAVQHCVQTQQLRHHARPDQNDGAEHVRVLACLQTRVYVWLYRTCIWHYVCVPLCVCVCVHICVRMNGCVCMYVYACCIFVCMCAQVIRTPTLSSSCSWMNGFNCCALHHHRHLMDKYCKSHRVTYSFYSGRRAMYDTNNCQHFSAVLFIPLKILVGWNLDLRILTFQSPISPHLVWECTCLVYVSVSISVTNRLSLHERVVLCLCYA